MIYSIALNPVFYSQNMNPFKNRKILSWCMFDFANSSYSAVIASVVFPVYYAGKIVGNEAGLGDLWWGRAVSLSMVFVAVSSPFLGGIADYGGIRKRFLFIYTVLCVASVAFFSVLEPGMIFTGFILAVLANIGMEGGLVFYNSFLPEIAEREYQGRVSSWGYALGYAGSILSLLAALPLVTKGLFGETWLMVAVFFMFFSIPAFLYLPPDKKRREVISGAAASGLSYTWKTFREIWKKRDSRRFLIAFLIYEDGVNTVIVFSSIFAATTFGMGPPEIIALYIFVQMTALAGAAIMARRVDLRGPKHVVSVSLILWILVAFFAFIAKEKLHFWLIAGVAGLGLGTVQAASRAFFAQFIPDGHESEYFGVYSLVGKSSAIAGPLIFGYLSTAYKSQRPAVLSVAAFFLAGLFIINTVKGGGPNTGKIRQNYEIG
jgi:UMF1 family MFS transporter